MFPRGYTPGACGFLNFNAFNGMRNHPWNHPFSLLFDGHVVGCSGAIVAMSELVKL